MTRMQLAPGARIRIHMADGSNYVTVSTTTARCCVVCTSEAGTTYRLYGDVEVEAEP